MRLRTVIWVKAYIRRCAGSGVPAMVVRHGDDDAGAVFIRVNRLDGTSELYAPAPAGLGDADTERQWVPRHGNGPRSDAEIEDLLAREAGFDPDLWIVEIEEPQGRHLLDGWLAALER